MDCNKDEAIRAKDIAESKFAANDFSGAKKFALKAQTLYPSLEGISHMLATIDIHISSENREDGEMDLYGMLGVNPMADIEVIKKNYKKLLLLIHPDKNKSIGAKNAFQLLVNAFRVLSDQTLRSLYNTLVEKGNTFWTMCGMCNEQYEYIRLYVDHKLRCRKCETHFTAVEIPTPSNIEPLPQETRPHIRKAPQKPSLVEKGNTFWTICGYCYMQYEFERLYVDHKLKCRRCETYFFAIEIPTPSNIEPLPQEARPHISGIYDSTGVPNAPRSRKRENKATQAASQSKRMRKSE